MPSKNLVNAHIASATYLLPLCVVVNGPMRSQCIRHITLGVTGMGINGATSAVYILLFF